MTEREQTKRKLKDGLHIILIYIVIGIVMFIYLSVK